MTPMLRSLAIVLLLCFVVSLPGMGIASQSQKTGEPSIEKQEDSASVQNHSDFEELQAEFESGPEVTAACLGCHDDIGDEVRKMQMWGWKCPSRGKYEVGKSGLTMNNMSISPVPNKFACYRCHISYRWEDPDLPFDHHNSIDCLTCHEQTNGMYDEYKKEWNPFLNEIAQKIGRPTKRNCGVCHFYRSGGDGALRGDLSSKLLEANRDLDVHMDANGLNFDCVDCHITTNHKVSGRCYENPAKISDSKDGRRYDCTSCHKQNLHKSLDKMNDHIDKVACETCHIPLLSREFHSRVWQDYSKAGKKKDGKVFVAKDEHGKKVYSTRSGEWRWAKNIKPEYFWFSGGFEYTLVSEKIDPLRKVKLNYTNTDFKDPQAKIYPFKVHRAKQPYDKVNDTLVCPKFTDKNKDSGAYWIDYDWDKAINAGMADIGMIYGGEHGFVETEYLYPIHHTVVPKEKALSCEACHTKKNGRLEKLGGFYMPGRDRSLYIDYGGLLCILALISGVLWHSLSGAAKRKRGEE